MVCQCHHVPDEFLNSVHIKNVFVYLIPHPIIRPVSSCLEGASLAGKIDIRLMCLREPRSWRQSFCFGIVIQLDSQLHAGSTAPTSPNFGNVASKYGMHRNLNWIYRQSVAPSKANKLWTCLVVVWMHYQTWLSLQATS